MSQQDDQYHPQQDFMQPTFATKAAARPASLTSNSSKEKGIRSRFTRLFAPTRPATSTNLTAPNEGQEKKPRSGRQLREMMFCRNRKAAATQHQQQQDHKLSDHSTYAKPSPSWPRTGKEFRRMIFRLPRSSVIAPQLPQSQLSRYIAPPQPRVLLQSEPSDQKMSLQQRSTYNEPLPGLSTTSSSAADHHRRTSAPVPNGYTSPDTYGFTSPATPYESAEHNRGYAPVSRTSSRSSSPTRHLNQQTGDLVSISITASNRSGASFTFSGNNATHCGQDALQAQPSIYQSAGAGHDQGIRDRAPTVRAAHLSPMPRTGRPSYGNGAISSRTRSARSRSPAPRELFSSDYLNYRDNYGQKRQQEQQQQGRLSRLGQSPFAKLSPLPKSGKELRMHRFGQFTAAGFDQHLPSYQQQQSPQPQKSHGIASPQTLFQNESDTHIMPFQWPTTYGSLSSPSVFSTSTSASGHCRRASSPESYDSLFSRANDSTPLAASYASANEHHPDHAEDVLRRNYESGEHNHRSPSISSNLHRSSSPTCHHHQQTKVVIVNTSSFRHSALTATSASYATHRGQDSQERHSSVYYFIGAGRDQHMHERGRGMRGVQLPFLSHTAYRSNGNTTSTPMCRRARSPSPEPSGSLHLDKLPNRHNYEQQQGKGLRRQRHQTDDCATDSDARAYKCARHEPVNECVPLYDHKSNIYTTAGPASPSQAPDQRLPSFSWCQQYFWDRPTSLSSFPVITPDLTSSDCFTSSASLSPISTELEYDRLLRASQRFKDYILKTYGEQVAKEADAVIAMLR
ncbi:hypothetical protein BGZ47_002712 [Haplosporangium gracile]|nr:hypothetical protein BGZ47_002712 [Haplosporangium gracile]